MQKILLVAATAMAASVIAGAATDSGKEFDQLASSCVGLDQSGLKRCLEIIAKYEFAPQHQLRPLSLAENTAFNAVLNRDPHSIIVVLPDGTQVLAHAFPDEPRVIGLQCSATPCPDP